MHLRIFFLFHIYRGIFCCCYAAGSNSEGQFKLIHFLLNNLKKEKNKGKGVEFQENESMENKTQKNTNGQSKVRDCKLLALGTIVVIHSKPCLP